MISVLMIVYNGARWLPESIPSVLSQTFGDLELIVVDDGSTDNTLEVVAALDDGRIRVIRKEHSGLPESRNAGAREARYPWIACLDADDVCMPHRLERQLQEVHAQPDVVAVGSDATLIDDQGAFLRYARFPTRHEAIVKRIRLGFAPFPNSSMLMRRAAFLAAGAYNPAFTRGEDYELWLRLGRLGQFRSVPEPLIKLRKHAASATGSVPRPDFYAYSFSAIALDALYQGSREKLAEISADHTFETHVREVDQLMESCGYYMFRQRREQLTAALLQGSNRGIRKLVGTLREDPLRMLGALEPASRRYVLWRLKEYWAGVDQARQRA